MGEVGADTLAYAIVTYWLILAQLHTHQGKVSLLLYYHVMHWLYLYGGGRGRYFGLYNCDVLAHSSTIAYTSRESESTPILPCHALAVSL